LRRVELDRQRYEQRFARCVLAGSRDDRLVGDALVRCMLIHQQERLTVACQDVRAIDLPEHAHTPARHFIGATECGFAVREAREQRFDVR
jgi:hypothetical protein